MAASPSASGGSAGGYTVLRALTQRPGFFRAGICLYGVSNLFTLAAETHKPTRGLAARGLDALQALLAALADRDQLGLDLAAALDRQADSVGLGASGHDLGISR